MVGWWFGSPCLIVAAFAFVTPFFRFIVSFETFIFPFAMTFIGPMVAINYMGHFM